MSARLIRHRTCREGTSGSGASTARQDQPLAGTDDPKFPFWSPDSRYIAFFSQGKLKKIDVSGGKPEELCIARNGRGGAWNRDGVIIVSGAGAGSLDRLPASGGTPVPLTKLDAARGESSHRFPLFLSDGRHYLFLVTSFGTNRDASKLGIYVGSLDSPEQKMLVRAQSNVSFANGYLLFVRDQTLYAQRFNEKELTVEGEPIPVVQGVRQWTSVAWADFTARGSVLAYQMGGASARHNSCGSIEREKRSAVFPIAASSPILDSLRTETNCYSILSMRSRETSTYGWRRRRVRCVSD